MVLYFTLFFGIALLFYAGSYNYGADVRYSLATYPPLMILAGLGASRIVQAVGRRVPAFPSLHIMTAAFAAQFLWYLPIVRTADDGAWAARADVRFARSFVSDLPRDSYVLTQNPGMFQLWGVNAGQMSLVAKDLVRLDWLAMRYAGGVYLHWNFWCNVQDPIQRGFCRGILDSTVGEPIYDVRERDEHYIVYRLRTRSAKSAESMNNNPK
jgi:hypothetical protein